MNRQVDRMRAQMGAIALRSAEQDARLAKLEAEQKRLDEFAEAIAPREPETYREVIRESARESGQSPDEIARLNGFASFNDVPANLRADGTIDPNL